MNTFKRMMAVGVLLAWAVLTRGQTNLFVTELGANGVLSFGELSNAVGYRVEWSTNLALPSWNTSAPPGIAFFPQLGSGTRSVTVGVGQAASHYRVVATVTNTPSSRPRGAYYVNFQPLFPVGPASPLVVGGKTYLSVEWPVYAPGVAPYYGWLPSTNGGFRLASYYVLGGTYTDIERTYVYDDYGRQNFFEFELEPGRYLVTMGVGRVPNGSGDPHNLTVEGQVVVNDEVLTNIQARTADVQLTDGRLSLAVGGWSASLNSWAYTFLAYMKVEPIN